MNSTFSPDGGFVLTGCSFAQGFAQLYRLTSLPPLLGINRVGSRVEVSWDNGVLESADQVLGPWTTVTNAVSPLRVEPNATSQFYRAKTE